jgi:mRNA-degrading endonuclease RelE of RelBE toxin-antitoxin system
VRERVAWEPAALEALLTLARSELATARRIVRAIYELGASGRGDVWKLEASSGQWRLRVGDWRILFVRESDALWILEIVNRRDVYR